MKYSDEFGFELNIPRSKNESVIEHIETSRLILMDMFKLHQRFLDKNTCKNPLVKVGENNA